MKSNLLIVIIGILLTASISAQNPVAYLLDGAREWTNISPEEKKILLDYANAGKYEQEITAEIDSVKQVILVEGIKSRSGNIEDQVWLQGHKDGKEVNLLLALKAFPQISDRCCVLTITAHRGDSNAVEEENEIKTKNPGLKRSPW